MAGFRTNPTPAGVPVRMIEPGSRVVACERKAIVWRTLKIWSLLEGRALNMRVNTRQERTHLVLPFWTVLPLSVHVSGSTCGSGMTLLEMMQGPRGVVLSEKGEGRRV